MILGVNSTDLQLVWLARLDQGVDERTGVVEVYVLVHQSVHNQQATSPAANISANTLLLCILKHYPRPVHGRIRSRLIHKLHVRVHVVKT